VKLALFAAFLFFAGAAFAATCPPGATDCFMCGAPPTGVPCNRTCTAHSVPGLGYVACEVPDEGPKCYCPYGTSFEEIAANSPDCRASSFPDCNGCGLLDSYNGNVLVKSMYAGSATDWCVVKGRLRLPQGTQVWTTANSAARITYPRVTLDVGPSSEMTINRVSLEDHSFLSLVSPRAFLRVACKELSEDEYFDMQVDYMFSGCRGTEYLVEKNDTHTTVKVLDGTVWVKSSESGTNVTLSPGQYTVVAKAGGPPSNPASFNTGGVNKWWSSLEGGGGGCGSAFIFLAAPLLLLFVIARR